MPELDELLRPLWTEVGDSPPVHVVVRGATVRRRRKRLVAGASLAVVGLAGGVGVAIGDRDDGTEVRTAEAPERADVVPAGTVRWYGARLGREPNELVVSFTGGDPALGTDNPCWEGYRPEVETDDERVVIRVRTLRSTAPPPSLPPGISFGCTLEGYGRTVSITLAEPLGERRLVDGSDGTPKAILDSPFLAASALPDGWTLRSESGFFEGPRGPVWTASYGPVAATKEADGPTITVQQGPASLYEAAVARRRYEVVDRPTVRGVTAEVLRLGGGNTEPGTVVRWIDDGHAVVVTGLDPVPPDDVLDLAHGLRHD